MAGCRLAKMGGGAHLGEDSDISSGFTRNLRFHDAGITIRNRMCASRRDSERVIYCRNILHVLWLRNIHLNGVPDYRPLCEGSRSYTGPGGMN